jgi:gluconolactonase
LDKMPPETMSRSNTPWIISAAAAAFAIGVATSDAIRDAVFNIQDAVMTYKGGDIPQVLTDLPTQAQAIYPSSFVAMSVVPPENVANVTSVS